MAILQTLKHQFFDSSGNPLSGGKLYAYVAGTSTPKDTYTDQGGLTANANPVILDSRGEASIWFNGSYKVVLKTAADATIWTVDNIQDPATGFVTLTGIETLTNKTLTSPSMSSPTITGAGVVTGSLAPSGAGTITATTATTATNTGGKTTIASAATPDIFATTVGTIVDYTGTATCTGFVAAPQAGATKRLICAGACLFTAGANLLIEGIASGNTITLAANAIVDVTAITTTQFKMTYSVSGSFTATGTGFSANPTATARYKAENGWVNLFIPDMIGVSNATSFTITGLPAPIVPVLDTVIFPIMEGLNSGAAVYVFGSISGGASSIILSNGHSSIVWTATGTKQLSTNQFVYRVG